MRSRGLCAQPSGLGCRRHRARKHHGRALQAIRYGGGVWGVFNPPQKRAASERVNPQGYALSTHERSEVRSILTTQARGFASRNNLANPKDWQGSFFPLKRKECWRWLRAFGATLPAEG